MKKIILDFFVEKITSEDKNSKKLEQFLVFCPKLDIITSDVRPSTAVNMMKEIAIFNCRQLVRLKNCPPRLRARQKIARFIVANGISKIKFQKL